MFRDWRDRGPTEQVLALVLCDISGYTRFISTHGEVGSHAFVVVGQLLKAVQRTLQPALRFAKFEGDAVFLYRTLAGGPDSQRRALRETLVLCDQAFQRFNRRRQELVEANLCPCEACVGARDLDLKILVSSGPTVLHRIGSHLELGGVEVIRLHRLLKNQVDLRRYLLVTESAAALLEGGGLPAYTEHRETDEVLGECPVRVYEPPLGLNPPVEEGRYDSVLFKTRDILTKILVGRAHQIGLVRPRVRS